MANEIDIYVARKIARAAQKSVPSKFSALNVAQYRALKSMYSMDKAGTLPSINVVSFANGVGKTFLMVMDMIGWAMGAEFLNNRVLPEAAVAFYDSLTAKRDSGKLSMRLVCSADDMKDGGSVHDILCNMFPLAKPVSKDQMGCYRQIDIAHPTKKGIVNHIAVKTFDQDVKKHSGTTCDRVWINEPLPAALVGETIGRIRSIDGGVQGSIAMFATLLTEAEWVEDLENSETVRLNHSRGHIYENCVGKDVTDAMAEDVRKSIGVKLERNPSGDGYITNGVLSKNSIEQMCAAWLVSHPSEYEARKCGAPISMSGRIYPTFDRDVHVVSEYKVNPKWPIIMVCDPHSAKPSAVIWAQVTPLDGIVVFEEWPNVRTFGRYETLKERPLTVAEECETWRLIEREYGITHSNIVCIGDPNRFRTPDLYTQKTLQKHFADCGYDFKTTVNDSLALGHAKVNERLYYDKSRFAMNRNDVSVLPKLFFHARCENVITAVKKYSMKSKNFKSDMSITENVHQRYKDFADTVRYLVMYHDGLTFEDMTGKNSTSADYAKFQNGRVPAIYKTPINKGFIDDGGNKWKKRRAV